MNPLIAAFVVKMEEEENWKALLDIFDETIAECREELVKQNPVTSISLLEDSKVLKDTLSRVYEKKTGQKYVPKFPEEPGGL